MARFLKIFYLAWLAISFFHKADNVFVEISKNSGHIMSLIDTRFDI